TPRSASLPYTTHFLSHTAHLIDMLAGDTELDRIAHRRAVLQTGNTGADLGEIAGEDLHRPAADLLAIFDGTGLDHELGETGGRQLLIQRQVEARGAGAYVGDEVLDARVIAQPLLQTSGLCLGRLERGALGQGQV